MKYLNIGCGELFDYSWTNIDITSNSAMVLSHNIIKGLPFQKCSFDICYSSHVLEHLTQDQAKNLLIECMRVLKPDGIIRLVVPDLEVIARNYLLALERSLSGNIEAQADYKWMMLELFDQMVREFDGGEMGKYLSRSDLSNREFILSRIGYEAEQFWKKQGENLSSKPNLIKKLSSKNFGLLVQKLRIVIAKFLVLIIAGKESAKAFDIGLFRNSGEVHQWMYDRFSLAILLEECGFVNIRVCQAHESRIPDFNSYGLDVIDGKVRKPDSLFIEACKP
ncbi:MULTISPECIES: class I SAM-dependent methyltransferase [Pseudanabaena]|uniref:Methyltransferase type 11 n=2 Tax=Pseudanabaena TaxID=1152 RepID=L8N3U1_9CYAN|nr:MULTISPECIES: methyltransferase domain-containing protein [Pseudanabaena]ELS34331.1 Methyltransferase type 11 [Pseudanabaena biceps PCC 7429]MDG3493473.1 methyltransferase domain-containing protein [Pseudanabaena catenata USMAC16]